MRKAGASQSSAVRVYSENCLRIKRDKAFSYLALLHLRPKDKVGIFLNEVKSKKTCESINSSYWSRWTFWLIVPVVRCSSLRKQQKPFVVLCLHPVYVWQNKRWWSWIFVCALCKQLQTGWVLCWRLRWNKSGSVGTERSVSATQTSSSCKAENSRCFSHILKSTTAVLQTVSSSSFVLSFSSVDVGHTTRAWLAPPA